MKNLTDSELVALAREDNEEAKEELFRRSKSVVSFSVRKYSGTFWKGLNEFDLEDLVSETSIGIMKAIRLYDSGRGASFNHFLKFIIRKELYNWVEKKIDYSNNTVSYEIPNKGKKILKNKLIAPTTLLDLIKDLTIKTKTDREKRVVELYLAGMVQTDIAAEMGITRDGVCKIIKRCIK